VWGRTGASRTTLVRSTLCQPCTAFQARYPCSTCAVQHVFSIYRPFHVRGNAAWMFTSRQRLRPVSERAASQGCVAPWCHFASSDSRAGPHRRDGVPLRTPNAHSKNGKFGGFSPSRLIFEAQNSPGQRGSPRISRLGDSYRASSFCAKRLRGLSPRLGGLQSAARRRPLVALRQGHVPGVGRRSGEGVDHLGGPRGLPGPTPRGCLEGGRGRRKALRRRVPTRRTKATRESARPSA